MAEAKRISVKYKTPNPLFEKWLTAWYNEAKKNNSKMQYTFNVALKTLRKYPLPFESGEDCLILKGFGNRLCAMLDKKLKLYKESKNNFLVREVTEIEVPTTPKNIKPKKSTNNPTKIIRVYKPTKGSGPYAILLTLLGNNHVSIPLSKAEIIKSAKNLCDTSFTKAEPGFFHTAWSSMRTLITKKLVIKSGNPPKFQLSDAGRNVAVELFEETENSVPDTGDIEIAQNIHNVINNVFGSTEYNCSKENDITNQRNENSEQNDILNDSSQASISKIECKAALEENTVSKIFPQTETIIFQPKNFDVILLVDTQETAGALADPLKDETIFELNKHGIKYEVRHLNVGDFTWICREKETKEELILPYVVERKRMDDLGQSIKDGRFHEQKFRLKQCGIQNLFYIVESYGNNTRTCLPLSSLLQGATNTLIQDKFQVKFTESLPHSIQYLSGITMMLTHVYEEKTLMSCMKENLEDKTIMDDLIPLMKFTDFNKSASKVKKYKVKEVFIKQLLQLNGLSVEKALAIVDKYPTPKLLKLKYNSLNSFEGEKLLVDIRFGPLKKSIGPAISKAIYQLYSYDKLQ